MALTASICLLFNPWKILSIFGNIIRLKWARRIVAIYGIRIAGTRFRLPPGPHSMLPKLVRKLLRWYDRYDDFNVVFAAFLFSIEVVHLVWLTTNVVFPRLLGIAPLIVNHLFDTIIAVVDYTEIPAIITTSLVYLRSYKSKPNKKDAFYIFFLNIQWLHIFWITDEVVIRALGYKSSILHWNHLVAWAAISIDYLELPVIFETIRRAAKILSKKI